MRIGESRLSHAADRNPVRQHCGAAGKQQKEATPRLEDLLVSCDLVATHGSHPASANTGTPVAGLSSNPPGEIQLDSSDDLLGGDHVHAPRQLADDVDAQLVGVILLVTVAERQRSRLPAAAVVAALQSADSVDELVVRISREVRRLTAAGNHDARAVPWRADWGLHRGGKVHQLADRADHALRPVDQPHELPQCRLAAKIDGAIQRRMMM